MNLELMNLKTPVLRIIMLASKIPVVSHQNRQEVRKVFKSLVLEFCDALATKIQSFKELFQNYVNFLT